MARKPRIEFEGAFYHVIVRGNQRQKIFKDTSDYQKYLDILAAYKHRYQFLLYAYVLMSNHVHLLIETQKIPISKILQGINQSYTMYFNRRYKTVGHLFQGRYKAILCDRDEYLLALIKYIHLNPVRSKIVKKLDTYPWSSHVHYAKKMERNILTDTDQVLRMFSEDKTQAKKLYRDFMNDKSEITKDDIYRTVDQRILGGERFIEKIVKKYDGKLQKERRAREYSLLEIAQGIEKARDTTIEQIRGRGKANHVSSSRTILCCIANQYDYKGKEIAQFIHRDPAVVSILLKDRRLYEDDIENIIHVLSVNN